MPANQALIFAAGNAERLLPLTETRPKGMLLVGGKPLLEHGVEALAALGVKKIVIVIGAHGQKVQSFLRDGSDYGVQILYVHQAKPTGTLDAVRLALSELDPDQPMLFLPGHALVSKELLKPLVGAQGSTLLVASAGDSHEQGVPVVRGNRLAGMRHAVPVVGSTRVTTNILRAERELVKAIEDKALDTHKEFDLALGTWAANGGQIAVLEAGAPWHVVIDAWHVLRLNEVCLDALAPEPARAGGDGPLVRGNVRIGKDTQVAPTATLIGPVTIGEGCSIGEFTVIGPYVSIRNATVVGSHCEVRRSILNNNVLLDSRAILRGSILDDGVRIGAGFICQEEWTPYGPHGCIVGRDSELGPHSSLQAGTMIAPETGRGPR